MSEHKGIPSFIQNVNYLAQNMHLLQLSEGLLTPETVKALKVATGLPFSEIIKDISKGVTPEGRRKIDIDYAEVPDHGSDYAHYTSITITGSLDNFSYTHEVGSVGVHELYDVQEAVKDAIVAYNGAAITGGLSPIENYVVEVHYPENPCKRPVIRIRDDVPEAAHTILSSITLHTESGIDLTTNWNDTTSSLLSLGTNQSRIDSADAVLRQHLADPDKGAAMVAYGEGTVADKLDEIVSGAVTEPIVDAKILAHNQDPAAHPRLRAFISGEADRAVAAKVSAEAAKVSSEAAKVSSEAVLVEVRRAVNLNAANIYVDVAAGLASTVNTENFWVLPNEGDGIENLSLYTNNASEAVKLYELYSLEPYMIEEGSNWEIGEL